MTLSATASSASAGVSCGWRWLDAHLELFTPWCNGEFSLERLQALTELAIVVARLRDAPGHGAGLDLHEPVLARWEEHVRTELAAPKFAQLARKRPGHGFPFVLGYLALRRTGWRDQYFEETLTLHDRWGVPHATEVTPFRELDADYFLAASDWRDPAPDREALVRRTFLGRMRTPLYVDDDAAYAITHTVLYLSDFGRRPPDMPGDMRRTAISAVGSLLVHYWRLRHWDLVAELLVSAAVLGEAENVPATLALAALRAAVRQDGALPGSAAQAAELERRGEGRQDTFAACYHTTVVALLLDVVLAEARWTA